MTNENERTDMDQGTYSSLWSLALRMLNDVRNDPSQRAKVDREAIYDQIRENSGLAFDGYGDEPERWIAWLQENKHKNYNQMMQEREENIRQRREEKA